MEEITKKMAKISEDFYGTEKDPDQIPITEETQEKLLSIHPETALYEIDKNNEPISWVIVIPTSLETMEEFLTNELTENELFEKAVIEKKFEALYLCSMFTMPQHQRKGLAKKLMLKAIQKLAPRPEQKLFSWAYSEEGRLALQSISKELKREILLKKSEV